MPTNLPPDALDKWEEVEAARGPREKMEKMQEFLKHVPQHKGTLKLEERSKRKIAIIRNDLEEKKRKSSIAVALGNFGWNKHQLFLIDTPANDGLTLKITGQNLRDFKPELSVRQEPLVVRPDAAGNLTLSLPLSVTVLNNGAAPTISGVTISGIIERLATVSWRTDQLTDAQLEYGPTTTYGTTTTLDPTLAAFHLQTLQGLTPGANHEMMNSAWGLALDNLYYLVDWNDYGLTIIPSSRQCMAHPPTGSPRMVGACSVPSSAMTGAL
jgi:hypothetical protein